MNENAKRMVRVVTVLNDAVGGGDVEAEWPASYATIALAMDYAERRRIYLDGCYGGIGRGGTWVELDMPDGGPLIIDSDDPERDVGDVPDGLPVGPDDAEGYADAVAEITGDVWDGKNHVVFLPTRALEYGAYSDVEIDNGAWGRITLDRDGSPEITLAAGWKILLADNSDHDGILLSGLGRDAWEPGIRRLVDALDIPYVELDDPWSDTSGGGEPDLIVIVYAVGVDDKLREFARRILA